MNMFEARWKKVTSKAKLFDYPLNDKQKEMLEDYEGKDIIMGVRPENIRRPGPVKLAIINNENLGMNTLVHGKIGGSKIVVCKFAEWCNYVEGDEIDIGFDPDMTHFFEHNKTEIKKKRKIG